MSDRIKSLLLTIIAVLVVALGMVLIVVDAVNRQ
jgi:hypothetical protein